MSTIIIRNLGIEDTMPIFKFELENRAWFESHVAPRPPDFYCVQGVKDHIEQLLSRYMAGTFHPSIILSQNGDILGRANLKDIDHDSGVAEIGYRIAQQNIGHGLATAAVHHMLDLARQQWRLKRLHAVVVESNRASMRVLEKCGFIQSQDVRRFATEANGTRDAHLFQLDLQPAN